jgi:phenylalanyl-tRNA synthetase alpha chain
MQDLDTIVREALVQFASIDDPDELERVKARFLGKTGALTDLLKGLGKLPPDQRPAVGSRINDAKQELEGALDARRAAIRNARLETRLRVEALDVTLPGRGAGAGGLHPINRILDRIGVLFHSLGFEIASGPEIETDYYNFSALNTPEGHPARSMHDTFYLDGGQYLLRTHTSPIQIRYMQTHRPPIRIIAPGRVYRVDYDATHSPMFHQIEGLWIDRDVSFANLKFVLKDFLQQLFERDDLEVRFRASYFPFTEPSAEVDMSWGEGRWLEIGGCGMVHPNVLRQVHIDPEEYQGFAFGMGLDRIAMLRYGVNDLRLFFENDLRFLRQFD